MPSRLIYSKSKTHYNKKKYYKPLRYPEIPLSTGDIYAITTVGDRLDNLAHQFYKDVDLWWIISIANAGIIRRDSINLKSGLEIRIPTDISSIIKQFEVLNK